MNRPHDPQHDPIVDRLRRALDELTADVGEAPAAPPAPVVSLDAARRERRWLTPVLAGAAAVAVVAAGVVVLLRDEADAPAATPEDTLPAPSSLPTPETEPPSTTPSTDEVPPVAIDLPTYALGAPGEFGDPSVLATRPTDMMGMAWTQPETGNVLTLYVRPGIADGDGPLGEYYVPMDGSFPEELGRAWVRGPEELGVDDGPSWMWWERPDGDVWMLTMHWGPLALSVSDGPLNARLTLRDWALSIEPGSGLPFILPDDSWDMLSFQAPGERNALSTVWTIDGHEVLLFTIEDSVVSGLNNLTSTMPIVLADLADAPGWLVPDGQGGYSAAGWVTPDTNVWNVLQIPVELSERSHELVKKLRRVRTGDDPGEVVPTALPTFTLDLEGNVSSGYLVEDVVEDTGDVRAYWVANVGADRAIVRVVRLPGGGRTPEGEYAPESLSGDWIGDGGRAWILRTPDQPRYVPIELFWDRGGETVLVGAYGLSPGDLEAVAQQAVAATEATEAWPDEIVLPGDGSWDSSGAPRLLSLVGAGAVGSTYTTQTWSVSGQSVTVAVHSAGPQSALDLAWIGLVVESVEVAGVYGWRAILPNNQTVVWWPVGETAWAVVNISPALVQRADDIIASITPTP